jgi:energy-coupling factor transporter ATP-binding protein EcfA2
MKLQTFTVLGLFGQFNHAVPLGPDAPIRILYGRNGVGKTTVLRLLHALFSRDYSLLRAVRFQSITAAFDDGTVLEVLQSGRPQQQHFDLKEPGALLDEGEFIDELHPAHGVGLKFNLTGPGIDGIEEASIPPLTPESIDAPLSYIERLLDHLERVSDFEWLDEFTGELLTLDQIVGTYSDQLPTSFVRALGLPRPGEQIENLINGTSVQFIETQRLRAGYTKAARTPSGRPLRRPRSTLAVEQYAQELAERIRSDRAQYLRISQQLDRDFPGKLIQGNQTPLDEPQIRARFNALVDKNARLARVAVQEAGLIPLPVDRELNECDRRVLGIYLDDAERKFSVFESYLELAEVFKEILDGLFVDKTLEIDRQGGFFFRAASGELLSPAMLSSGEQHEVILTYDLLFRFKPGSIILIDEPEISLHVAWQRDFIDNVLRISELRDFELVVATHSPQIVDRHADFMVELS